MLIQELKVSPNFTVCDTACRIDTPAELSYYQHGGILQYVLRQLLSRNKS